MLFLNLTYTTSRVIKFLLSKREWRPSLLFWQICSLSLFQNQQFLCRSPGPELCQGWAEVWKAIDHLEKGHWTLGLVSKCDLDKQGVPPPARLTYYPKGQLRVTPGSLTSAHGPWANVHLLSVVLFYDSQSRSLGAVKHEDSRGVSCWSLPPYPREGSTGGRVILKHPVLWDTVAFARLDFLHNFIWNSVFSFLPASRYFMKDFDGPTCLVILAPSRQAGSKVMR